MKPQANTDALEKQITSGCRKQLSSLYASYRNIIPLYLLSINVIVIVTVALYGYETWSPKSSRSYVITCNNRTLTIFEGKREK